MEGSPGNESSGEAKDSAAQAEQQNEATAAGEEVDIAKQRQEVSYSAKEKRKCA